MTKTEYQIIRQRTLLPVRTLVKVPYKNSSLTASLPAFGPGVYSNNLKEMQKQYAHPETGETISFREPTTAESIAIASYAFKHQGQEKEFAEVKTKIFDPRWLQLGLIVRTSKGICANPGRDAKGEPIKSESILEKNLKSARKTKVGKGHIYLSDCDFCFAEYETFNQGEQSHSDFLESGLAKVLENSEKVENLSLIATPKFYKLGTHVWGFDAVKEPIARVASLYSYRNVYGRRLSVGGNGWDGYDGCVFGVSPFGSAIAEGAQKI